MIEDLGDLTFAKLLDQGASETVLYSQAVRLLAALHDHPDASRTALEPYDFQHFIDEALLFVDWYFPAVAGKGTSAAMRARYVEAWNKVYQALPALPNSLVLRDYHVDNLMQVDHECAVLDYQDALAGSIAYDLVSLLEDARRDISPELRHGMIELYCSLRREIDRDNFLHHCAVWGAGRHAKVAGIFTRLWVRDNKPAYLKHIPRVLGYFARSMEDNVLEPVRNWLSESGIELTPVDHRLDRKRLLERSEQ